MSYQFRVGQEVCCIRDMSPVVAQLFTFFGGDLQEKGKNYFINEIRRDTYVANSDIILLFKGMRPGKYNGAEFGWESGDFRPLIETNISIFTSMLTKPPKQKVKANAG